MANRNGTIALSLVRPCSVQLLPVTVLKSQWYGRYVERDDGTGEHLHDAEHCLENLFDE